MASHQYPRGKEMLPEDFWNIAGRTGRISHGALGVVGLVAESTAKAQKLRNFIDRQAGALNSALIELIQEAGAELTDLRGIVNQRHQWSAFVQYLVHTYQQMGKPEDFISKTEQILRNTLGFRKLRAEGSPLADSLLDAVYSYVEFIQKPRQPIKLVDSTGFSLESILTVLRVSRKQGIRASVWNKQSLFSSQNQDLQGMMGVLLNVPELRENMKDVVIGGADPDGAALSHIVSVRKSPLFPESKLFGLNFDRN